MNKGVNTSRAFIAVGLVVIPMVVAATHLLAACTGGSCDGIGGIFNVQTVMFTQ